MRPAVRFHELGQPPRLDEVEAPKPATGQIVLDVRRASITHLDRTVSSGDFELHPPLPYVGGVEGIGVVDGTRFLVRGRGIGLMRDGCWTTSMAVPCEALLPVPESLDDNTAAVFFAPASTAARAVEMAGVTGGMRVLVTGASGAVGSLVVQLCRSAGARVVGVVSRPERAADTPCDDVVVGRGRDAINLLSDAPDVLIDTVGGHGVADLVMAVVPGGTAVLVGYTAGREMTLHLPSWLLREVTIVPVNMVGAERWARDRFEHLAAQFASGVLSLRTEVIGLADVPHALDRLAAGDVTGRLVVDPWQ